MQDAPVQRARLVSHKQVKTIALSPRATTAALGSTLLLIAAGLIVYSQTYAYAFDEGFHLIAAQLIAQGKRPYLDFLFPQTPLNAYWNALLIRMFGPSWRAPHAAAAIETTLAVGLIADYVYRRLPEPSCRMGAAVFTLCSFGLNIAAVQFGTTAQAYGLCLLLVVAGFRAAIAAVDQRGIAFAALAGLLSSAAAASSLLTAPFAPVLLLWIVVANRVGSRITKSTAFIVGAIVPCLPLLWLLAQSPAKVIFDVLKYHLFFRTVNWSGWGSHDVEVALEWIDHSPALILVLLAAGGLLFVRKSGWDRTVKAEFYLCGLLALIETIHLLNAHPTFTRYFLFTVPFLTIVASAGVCAYCAKLASSSRPRAAVIIVCCIMVISVGKRLFQDRDDMAWADVEAIAAKVNQVTPPGAPLYADEGVYFAGRRTPLPGMEYNDSHKLTMSADQAASLHIMRHEELDHMVRSGVFRTIETCEDDEIDKYGLDTLYSNKEKISDCTVFWGFK